MEACRDVWCPECLRVASPGAVGRAVYRGVDCICLIRYLLEHVEFGSVLIARWQHPEGRPKTLFSWKLGSDFEVAVLLGKRFVGGDDSRVIGKIVGIGAGCRRSGRNA